MVTVERPSTSDCIPYLCVQQIVCCHHYSEGKNVLLRAAWLPSEGCYFKRLQFKRWHNNERKPANCSGVVSTMRRLHCCTEEGRQGWLSWKIITPTNWFIALSNGTEIKRWFILWLYGDSRAMTVANLVWQELLEQLEMHLLIRPFASSLPRGVQKKAVATSDM